MELLKQMIIRKRMFVKSNEFQASLKEVLAAEKSWEQVKQCKSIIDLNNRLIAFIDKSIKEANISEEDIQQATLEIDKNI
jgi:hypothetical protein